MRRAWFKSFNKKRRIQLNNQILYEAQSRARYLSEPSVKVRQQKEDHIRDRIIRLTGIPGPWKETQALLAFRKDIEDRGANIDRHICLQNGKMHKLLLFYSARGDKWVFVKIDLINNTHQFSIRYNSRQRAFKVYEHNHITWIS